MQQAQISQYFYGQVQPVFETLIVELAKTRPEDILQHSINHFRAPRDHSEGSESDDDDRFRQVSDEDFKKMRAQKMAKMVRKHRTGMSAEANTMSIHKSRPINLRKTGKKPQGFQIKIKFYFSNSFLFKDFQEEEQNILIDSLVEQRCYPGQTIIKEGQLGDCMYFVQDGLFECFLRKKEGRSKMLKNYQAGDVFGQICLLHVLKRQASIISRSQGILYSLSRQIYIHLKKMSISKKRDGYLLSLKQVGLFSDLTKEELQRVSESLKEKTVEDGTFVIHEGDMGANFYIVLEGMLVAKSKHHEVFYQYYKEGDYFGEVALIEKKPRQASVQAVTKCRLAYLSSTAFLKVVDLDKAKNQLKSRYRAQRPRTIQRRHNRQATYFDK